MTREEAINYLKSSGMTEEQIKSVIDAFICEDCISRTEAMDMILCYGNEIKAEVMDDIKASIIKLPSVTPKVEWIPVNERLPEEWERVLVSDTWCGVYVGQYIPLPQPYKAEGSDEE